MLTRKFFVVAALLASTSAVAQVSEPPAPPELDAQRYHPTFDSRKTLWTETSGFNSRELAGSGRLFLNYANDPLVWEDPVTEEDLAYVSDVLTLNVLGSVAYNRFRFGVDVPVYLVAASGQQIDADGAGTGDIALDARVTGLDHRTDPFGLGLSGRLSLPTASVPTSLGSPGVTGEINLLVDGQIEPIYLAANVGTRLAPQTALDNIDVGSQFLYKAAAAYTFDETDAGISLDFSGNANYTQARSLGGVGVPLEFLAGGWYRLTDDWVLRGGAGKGLTQGLGSPLARVVVSIAYERPLEGDKDKDGIFDFVDQCPDEAEDFDEFEDENGCPDYDNDGDGIADVDDNCPLRAEDADGFRDKDGCPDESTQVLVRVIGPNDKELPTATVAITGPEDAAGASGLEAMLHKGTYTATATAANYEPMSVEFTMPGQTEVVINMAAIPGTLRVVARTPNGKPINGATFTLDGVKGPVLENGEVESQQPSGLHTIVVRADDFAPYKEEIDILPEDMTEVVAILAPTKVKVTRDKIEIKDKVFFDTGKATIKPVSFALLNEVAQIIQDYPEIRMVRIEGHTDDRGSESSNQTLSEARATSVLNYLKDQGVEAERMNSVGYGESKPLVKGSNNAAWDKNRRVEFFVEEWDAEMAPER